MYMLRNLKSVFLLVIGFLLGSALNVVAELDSVSNFVSRVQGYFYSKGISKDSCRFGERIAIFSYADNIDKSANGLSDMAIEIAEKKKKKKCKVPVVSVSDNKDYKGPNKISYFFREDQKASEHLKNMLSTSYDIEFQDDSFLPEKSKGKHTGYLEVWVE